MRLNYNKLGIPGFEWQTRGNFRMFLARRGVYGFLFSVRRGFHGPFTVPFAHAAWLVLGQLMCYGGEVKRTEKRNP